MTNIHHFNLASSLPRVAEVYNVCLHHHLKQHCLYSRILGSPSVSTPRNWLTGPLRLYT